MNIEQVAQAAFVFIEEVFVQFGARHHPAVVQGEVFDQGVFPGGQGHQFAVAADVPRAHVETDRAKQDLAARLTGHAPLQGAQARGQFAQVEGFRQVVVGTKIQTAHLVADPAARGQDQHGGAPLLAQPAQHLEAIQDGQHEIEHDGVVVGFEGLEEPLLAIGRLVHGMPLLAQRLCQRAKQVRFILDNEQPHEAMRMPRAALSKHEDTGVARGKSRLHRAGGGGWLAPSMSSPASFAYRPDIDGLRGVAVLLVVLFHAHISFRGGFIGVDVFFVISGYLITGLMRRDLEAGGFRLGDFWERRARRILPALAVMALLTLLAGAWLLLPEDLERLGESAMAQSLFVANLYFWREGGGYFAGSAEQMPLLHLWSLAVEEQFYLLMPPLCLLLARRAARTSEGLAALGRRVFGALALISLCVSVWLVRHDAHSAFYWLPTRAWELLLGSLLACMPLATTEPRQRAWVGIAGLGAILLPGLLYDAGTPFPGLAALPPCLGAAALIWAGRSGPAARLLESRPLLHFGRISYSLYLWHWPLLALAAALSPVLVDADSRGVRVGLVLAAWGLAVLSWRWIENPVRARVVLKSRAALFTASGLVLALLFAAGAGLSVSRGLPERLPASAVRLATATAAAAAWPDALEAVLDGSAPRFGHPQAGTPVRVLLWGDSHAKSLVPVLADGCAQQGAAGLLVAHSATAPVVGFHRSSRHGLDEVASRAWAEAVLETVRRKRVPDTVLAAYWSKCHGREADTFGRALIESVRLLRAAGTRVWIVLDVPVHDFAPPRALGYHALHPGLFRDPRDLAATPAAHRERNAVMEALRAQLEAAGAHLLDPASLLFDEEGRARLAVDGEPLYADGDHLTQAGSLLLKPLFAPVFTP